MSRTDLDLLIDIAWHEVMVALRTPAEIEQLERERGLR